MAKSASAHLDTLLQHTGTAEFDPVTGAAPVALPSTRTSTVRFQNLDALDRTQAGKAKGERSVTYGRIGRSEEHTSELQSLMRISYAVFCLKKKKNKVNTKTN